MAYALPATNGYSTGSVQEDTSGQPPRIKSKHRGRHQRRVRFPTASVTTLPLTACCCPGMITSGVLPPPPERMEMYLPLQIRKPQHVQALPARRHRLPCVGRRPAGSCKPINTSRLLLHPKQFRNKLTGQILEGYKEIEPGFECNPGEGNQSGRAFRIANMMTKDVQDAMAVARDEGKPFDRWTKEMLSNARPSWMKHDLWDHHRGGGTGGRRRPRPPRCRGLPPVAAARLRQRRP